MFTVTLPLAAPAGVVVHEAPQGLDQGFGPQDAGYVEEHAFVPAPSAVTSTAPLVLVVEDNPDMNAFLVHLLGQFYRVASAFDGREGLEKALALAPDAIISDVMMPGVDGEAMVREVRRHAELDDVPIIMNGVSRRKIIETYRDRLG